MMSNREKLRLLLLKNKLYELLYDLGFELISISNYEFEFVKDPVIFGLKNNFNPIKGFGYNYKCSLLNKSDGAQTSFNFYDYDSISREKSINDMFKIIQDYYSVEIRELNFNMLHEHQ